MNAQTTTDRHTATETETEGERVNMSILSSLINVEDTTHSTRGENPMTN